ncbi:sugar ABC transporter ATP-binding protein [Kaistia dalseonensis]|uniref:ABC-type sugar transport system ATPase subunit n=1 Tax=Kaistia dalseonensis TaxID=410840 RepID=A0ABU0H963_9HYPH|nr:sugar ABC transporter ATP-binding protein [Kaistia dalseonensis]MCX5496245.1 sugar ABC transporter ATP-binding protein [Kaistia dalseonensis]MDQ0438862.1 ABC-type sugar transport system ATPase subunit [Kaistia dalseonensis]
MIRLTGKAITKRYGATRALDGLDLDLASGEIIGIAGPNGAGKSTLMRMLAGEEKADSGEIVLTRPDGPVQEVWRRVAVVHQEPHVWPNMTVEQNLAVGREGRWFGRVAPDPDAAGAVLERLGIAQFAHHELADLSLAVQQRVEIARAMLSDADVYLFDEPNSALTEQESEALFATMGELAADDRIVLLITHRLNDFVRSCQRVLVLRDGRISGEINGAAISETAIAAQLTATHASQETASTGSGRTARSVQSSKPVLRLDRCSDRLGAFNAVSIDLMPGRIVALSGVEGSGARELAQAIGAFRPIHTADGSKLRSDASVSYLAASRRHTVFHNMSVGENLAARLGGNVIGGRGRLLDPAKIETLARRSITRYRVKTGGTELPITALSGGNQQKVVLGAAMEQNTDIIVIEEPTRGVDISSKADIYELLRDFAAEGRSVVVFCTEVQEIFDAADEVVVLSRGAIVGRIDMAGIADIPTLADLLARYESGPAKVKAG